MPDTREKLTEILRNGILVAMDDDNRYLYTDVVDYMMAHGVTINDASEQAFQNGYSAGYAAGRRSVGESKQGLNNA